MISDDDIAKLEHRWRKAMEHPRQIKVLTPLPRRTRIRLAISHQIDKLAIWLGDHVSWTAAEHVWRLTGQWNRRR